MGEKMTLLPCPWCGEELQNPTVSEGSTFRWRKVDGCCADGPEVRHDTRADDQEAAEVESRAAAIEAWNTRAHLTQPAQAVDVGAVAFTSTHNLSHLRSGGEKAAMVAAKTEGYPVALYTAPMPDAASIALLRECYEWLFESHTDGPRVSEGALEKGWYSPEFRALHDKLTAALPKEG